MTTNELVDSILEGIQNIEGLDDVNQIELVKASAIIAGIMMQEKNVEEIELDEFIIKLISK